MAAGPWFTVQESGGDWNELSSIWISNGQEDGKGRIEVRVRLVGPDGSAESGRHNKGELVTQVPAGRRDLLQGIRN